MIPSATSMLVTESFGDNFEMFVTVLAIFVTNILYHSTLALDTNIQNTCMSSISKFRHKYPKIVTNIKSPTSTCHQHLCSRERYRQEPNVSHTSVIDRHGGNFMATPSRNSVRNFYMRSFYGNSLENSFISS